MARKSNSKEDVITIEDILEEISSFDATYAELLRNLASKPAYKQLKGISQQQFFDATESNYTDDEERKRIRRQYAEIQLLVKSADSIIDDVISEKFQGSFLGELKEEVLKIILKLYADRASTSSEEKDVQSSQPAQNSTEAKRNKRDKNKNSENFPKDFKNNGVSKNSKNSEVPIENTANHIENIESILTTIKREEDDDFGNLSFDSVSSVHTSDLSSFNDDISLPSDEESGKKGKRISFKMAEEEVVKLKEKRLKKENVKEKQSKGITSDEDETIDDSSKSPQKSLPQRVRKPNSKYSEYVPTDSCLPLKDKFAEKPTSKKYSAPAQSPKTVQLTSESTPRKRGRPRKNP